MKWLLIAALWSTNPPQDDFKFYTKVFYSRADCEAAAQILYAAANEQDVQAKAACKSQTSLGLAPTY